MSESASAPRSARRRQALLAGALAVGGVLAIGLGSNALRAADDGPRPLRLSAFGQAAERSAYAPTAGAADAVMWTGYVLDDSLTLPGGTPADTPAYEFPALPRDLPAGAGTAVARLVAALGLDATPKDVDGAWLFSDGQRQLRVERQPGLPWSYMRQTVWGTDDCRTVDGPLPAPEKRDGAPGGTGSGAAPYDPGTGTVEPVPPDLTPGKVPMAPGTGTPGTRLPLPAPTDALPLPLPAPVPDIAVPPVAATPEPAPPTGVVPDSDVVCARATVVAPAPVPDARVRSAAAPVLSALGLDARDGTIAYGSVMVDPRIGGLPTSGLTTSVNVDGEGVFAANGWLAEPAAGDAYPVIGAAEAFERLTGTGGGREIDLSCRVAEPPPAKSAPGGYATDAEKAAAERPAVTGTAPDAGTADGTDVGGCVVPAVRIVAAEFGLSVQYEERGPLLVPSWLFRTADGWAIPAVAVAEKYLTPPEEPADPSGDTPVEPVPGDVGIGGDDPGVGGTDPGTSVGSDGGDSGISVDSGGGADGSPSGPAPDDPVSDDVGAPEPAPVK